MSYDPRPRFPLITNVRPQVPRKQETATCPTHPTKDAFQFIQIHQASGRPDAAGGAQMRRHIKRNYFNNLRRRERQCSHTKVELRSKQFQDSVDAVKSLVSSKAILDAPRLQTSPPTALSTERPLLSKSLQVWSSESQEQGMNTPSFRHEVVCVECGRLLLQYFPNERKRRDGSFGSSQAPSGNSSYDPFDSAAIRISHTMHELIHYCMYAHTSYL